MKLKSGFLFRLLQIILLVGFSFFSYGFTTSEAVTSQFPFRELIILFIAAIIPLTALAYAKFRQHIRHLQLNHYLNCLCGKDVHYDNHNLIKIFAHDASLTSHKDLNDMQVVRFKGFLVASFRLSISVLVATLMTAIGLSMLFYSEEIYEAVESEQILLLGGMEIINYSHQPVVLRCENIAQKGTDLYTACDSVNARQVTDCKQIDDRILKEFCNNIRNSYIKKYQSGALLMMGMASLGAVVWGLLNIVRRYMKYDINSGVYYSMAVRIFTASIVSLVIYHGMDALTDGLFTLLAESNGVSAVKGDKISSILPSLALLIGMFPERGIYYLKQRFSAFQDKPNEKYVPLPLSRIEGIAQHEIVRLNEISIDNCYVLAEQRVIPLLLSTPFTPNLIINFIAQAKLCAFFPEAIDELRSVGIKNILHLFIPVYGDDTEKGKYKDLLDLGENKTFSQHIVDETRIKLSHIHHVLAELNSDWETRELYCYSRRLSGKQDCDEFLRDKKDNCYVQGQGTE